MTDTTAGAVFGPDELAEVEARAEAATEGPWTAEYSGETGNCVLPPGYESTREYVARTQLYLAVSDAVFIAAARTDVPRLAEALRSAWAERDQAQAELARFVEQGEERFVQQLVDETAIKSMSIRNGTMDMDLSVAKYIGAAMVGAAKAMLGDAPNYTETVAWDVKVAEQPQMYTLVVQRHEPGTLTPHQARQKAEAELSSVAAALRALVPDATATDTAGLVQAVHERITALTDLEEQWGILFADGSFQRSHDETWARKLAAKSRFGNPVVARRYVTRWEPVDKAEALAADAPAAADQLVEPDPTRTCLMCGTAWTAEIDGCPHCGACCDSHSRTCEPPSELCCERCTEVKHYTFPYPHADGSTCVLADAPAAADAPAIDATLGQPTSAPKAGAAADEETL